MTRILALIFGLAFLSACAVSNEMQDQLDLGEFSLGHNVVVASKMTQGPLSRDATQEEWTNALKSAVDQRFGRYDGSQLYHIGMSVEGFMLAPPGLPVVYNPRSLLVLNVTIWDDAAAKKLNSEVEQFSVFEDTTGGSVLVGSGHTRTREEQMAILVNNAMDQVENWMSEQHAQNGWFDKRPGTGDTEGQSAQAAASGATPATDAVKPADE